MMLVDGVELSNEVGMSVSVLVVVLVMLSVCSGPCGDDDFAGISERRITRTSNKLIIPITHVVPRRPHKPVWRIGCHGRRRHGGGRSIVML